MTARGIVIAPPISSTTDLPFDPIDFRTYALYWDFIDCPVDALGGSGFPENSADIDLLTKEGMFTRTRGFFYRRVEDNWLLSFHLENPQEFWTTAQLYALVKHKETNTRWSMGQVGTEFVLTGPKPSRFAFVQSPLPEKGGNVLAVPSEMIYTAEDQMDLGPAISLELSNILPVVTGDTPMNKVLEFKQKRKDEYLRFGNMLEGLYLRVASSNDPLRQNEYEVEKLQLAIADLNKVMHESGLRPVFSTLAVSLSITPLMREALTRLATGQPLFAHSLGLPELTTTLGVALGAINVTLLLRALKPKCPPDRLMDYAYLYRIEKDLRGRVKSK